MSDEKIRWSEQQPDDWQGAPLGTPSEWPAPVTPPIAPSPTDSLPPVPVAAAIQASWKLLKAQYHHYVRISATVLSLGALIACGILALMRANNLISDDVITLAFRGTGSQQLNTWEQEVLTSQWLGLVYLMIPAVVLSALSQTIAQILISARALSRVSSTPEVAALNFAWWPAISSQLALGAIVIGAALPFVALLSFASLNVGTAVLALIAAIGYLVFVIWFVIVSMMTLQHSIATGVGGFACVKQTVKLSKGARAATFVTTLLMGIVFAAISSFVTTSLQTAFVSASITAQANWFVISQFISAILTVPATTVALSVTYSLRRSIR